MNSEVEYNIRNNVPWNKLPSSVKKSLGNSQKEYEKEIITFSINNQLRFRSNLVFQVRKDEQRYYEELLAYSRTGLLLYPYHLSDIIVKGLRVTPFQYYTRVLETIMEGERSYDSLPNFTAADCLRLLGIGRNEYIDIMNQCRSGRKLFRRKNVKDLLPVKPIDIHIEPWWIVETGYIVEEDMKLVSQAEKDLIDRIIDYGKQRAGDLDHNLVHSLYKKGLIYLEVPIEDTDHIVVPPLEGFVMNRVLGDYFETLLYKIFVSIDEHTSVGELASVLQIDLQAVKQAVSLYCRLGFARKKVPESEQWHPTWNPAQSKIVLSPSTEIIPSFSKVYSDLGSPLDDDVESNASKKTRIAFLFDSTLTAFLMMGNLSPGLKSHAVTMFEVGKLTDESMDSFLCELEKVSTARDDSEGEARRYFEHALVLRSTVLRLRHRGLDLVRCESLQSLDRETCTRLLNKNYSLLVSMAPLSGEVTPITSLNPPHLGPPCPLAHTLWFKLFLYHITRSGPPSILIARGTRLRKLPRLLRSCDKALVTSWGHDPTVIATSSLLFTLNDALCYSPVLAQAYGTNKGADTHLIPFPFPENPEEENGRGLWRQHPSVVRLEREIGLNQSCGYLTMVEIPHSLPPDTPPPIMKPKERLRLPLRDASELHCLDTPATPSSMEAWIKTMSGDGDSRVKAYSGSPMKEEADPANGLTSQECAHLLEQEIDGLADSNHSSPASRGSDSKEEVPCRLPLRVKLTPAPAPANLSDWSLLDCSYGIPLFDAELNEIICRSVVERLSQKESLDNLTEYNSSLTTRLSEFIETVQGWGEESSGIDSPFSASQDNSWPLLSITFLNGQLAPWDGK